MEMRTSMESLGKEGDNQKIRTSFEHIKMDMPAMRMHYETGKSEPGSPMAILDSMSNMKMVMFMDKQMKVTKFEFEGANIEALKDQFDNMKQNLNSGMAILPDHPVKKGESWNADIEVSSGVKMKMHTKYTLKDVKDGRAVLEVDGKMEIPSQDNKGMNMSGDGTIKGSSEVDMKTGMTLKSDLVQDMNMKTNVMGKDMSMKIKNSIGVFEAK
jgi:hypothetical protein